jgi:hypothetical protein
MTTPRIVNFILADRIIREVDGRYGAVGIFSNLTLRTFVRSEQEERRYGPPWGILVELAGFAYDRQYTLRLSVKKADNSEPTAYGVEGTLTAQPSDPESKTGFMHFNIPPFVKYTQGTYIIEFKLDGRSLKRQSMEAINE